MPFSFDLTAFAAGRELPARWRWGVPLALLTLTLLVYANSFPSTFIQDDIHIVVNNPLVKSFDLMRIFTSDYWYGIENSGLYRPLTIFSLALNRLLLGTQPWGFHLINVLLHGGVTILLWLTLPRWGAPRGAALVAAVLFALHPLHTEVINIVVGRSELLAAFFLLLALYFAASKGRGRHVLVGATFALALLSKEHAIVLLALLPLFDAHRARSLTVWRQRWPLYLGMLAVVALWLLVRLYGVQHVGPRAFYSSTAVPLAYLPWGARVLTALQYQWVYLLKLFAPLQMHAVYSLPDLPPILTSLWSPRAFLVVIATLLSAGLTFFSWRCGAWWTLPLLAYAISFAPTANILIPIGVTMAERLAYFPSLWFCALMGWCGAWLLQAPSRWRYPLLGGMVCYVLFLAITTGIRNRDFVSEIALWQREITVNSEDYLGWQSYAESLNASGRDEEADLAYQRLLRMQPEFPGALRSYFVFLFGHGRYQEAIVQAEASLRQARAQGDRTGASYDLTNLATVYLELRDYPRALTCLKEPEVSAFEQRDIYLGLLGRAYQGVGDHARAVEAFTGIKSYEMDLYLPLYFANSLFNLGRLEEAQLQLRESIRLNESPEAWNLLGTILAQQENYREAVNAFSRAVALAPGQQHYRLNLEKALALLVSPGSIAK